MELTNNPGTVSANGGGGGAGGAASNAALGNCIQGTQGGVGLTVVLLQVPLLTRRWWWIRRIW